MRETSPAYTYQIGGSLPIDAPTYVKRQADWILLEELRQGEFCYILNSRQMGKSSLRVQVMQQLQQEGFTCAVIDMTSIGTANITPEQWYAGLINSLINNFELYTTFNLTEWWTNHNVLSPVQRLSQFLETVLLKLTTQKIVIFIDEIDSILSLKFNLDDFFALIRDCYNRRADQPNYRRLTFTLIGVSTPSDLIRDHRRTPFNIGRAIELGGLQRSEAQPLAAGLAIVGEPNALIGEILTWTGGQPFLTQKICKLIVQQGGCCPPGTEATWVERVVRQYVIEHWEAQDEPEHLKTIRDRLLLGKEQRSGRLLGLCQQIIQQGTIAANDSLEQIELRLSGLVVKQQETLQIYNPIYADVFTLEWVDRALANLRPYAKELNAWMASDRQDESRLLWGQSLKEAQVWAADKSLSDLDYQFLAASQDLEKREVERHLEISQKAQDILATAYRTARRRIRLGFQLGLIVLMTFLVISGIAAFWAVRQVHEAQQIVQLENAGTKALNQFRLGQIAGLLPAIQAGQELQRLVGHRSVEQYPSVQPLWVLQTILDTIREHNQLVGHEGVVNSASFSSDGRRIVTTSDDKTVRIWDASGQPLVVLQGHQDVINRAEFSPDGQSIASASNDGTVILWNLAGQPLKRFTPQSGVIWDVHFSPDGQRIITASQDGTAQIWDVRSGQKLIVLQGHQGNIWSANFSADGQRIVTASEDKTARIWDASGRLLMALRGHENEVLNASFNAQGDRIVTASSDQTARLWDLSGQTLAQLGTHEGAVNSASFSPDGQHIVTASYDTTVRLWDLKGRQLLELNGHGDSVNSASFSPDGNSIVTASWDGTVRLWRVSNPRIRFISGHRDKIASVNYSPDGQHIVTASWDRTARLWDALGKPLQELIGHQDSVSYASFSPDSQQIVTASWDKTASVWNATGHLIQSLQGHQDRVTYASFSPDGQRIVTASYDQTARVWGRSGRPLAELRGHQGIVWSAVFSPDGQKVLTASDDGTARIWTLSGRLVAELTGHQGSVNSAVFSLDGQHILTASNDTTVRLWMASGELLTSFKAHLGTVWSANFSYDGKEIVTTSSDRTARVFDLSGRQLAEYRGHQDSINSASFSPNGTRIATASSDRTIGLWRADRLDSLLNQGCHWLQDYFKTHPADLHSLTICRAEL
ncbi:MAG TPA: AAA-like domain-containing protein [Crinalium sp.]|jgi:WD40 repeat protein